ncbi:hypothetical protein MMC11_004576 [Xylographa trunciseda]|nr:hypothetical protein [Xylographa trunciseda]
MPSYMCGAITVKLSAADLENSTTRSLINQHGKEQTIHSRSIEDEPNKSLQERPLAELPLFTEDGQPSRLQFLGAHQDMPFLMVKAGRSLNASDKFNREYLETVNQSIPELTEHDPMVLPLVTANNSSADSTMTDDISSDNRTRPSSAMDSSAMDEEVSFVTEQGSITSDANACINQVKDINQEHHPDLTRHDEPLLKLQSSPQSSLLHSDRTTNRRVHSPQDLKPQALCLTVQLSKKSFLPNPYSHMKKLRALDIKIDIYYNGELCTSCYVPERLRAVSSIAELTQRFGGRRVDRLLEQPWIIVPSGQNADGSLREHRRGKGDGTGARQRWKAVSHVLKQEAERGGRNKWGDLSVLGDYLESLSMLEMPKEVENLQKGGGVRYGIIDVVLTAGHGKKDNPDAGYLSGPARMRTSGLRESGLETTVKVPKSIQVSQQGRPLAMPTAKQRAKVSADTEIIQSGFSSLAPRRQMPILSSTLAQQPGNRSASTPRVIHGDDVFPAPSAVSTAPSSARRRNSAVGQVIRASENLASLPAVVDSSSTLQLGKLPRPRPSYRGSGPASTLALGNYIRRKKSTGSVSAWAEFLGNRGGRSVSPAHQRAGDYVSDISSDTDVWNGMNARRHRGQLSQDSSRQTSCAPRSSVQNRPNNTAQKRYKGSDLETQEDARGEQRRKKNKEQIAYTQVVIDKPNDTQSMKASRAAGDLDQERRKKSRMGYINVLTNKLTEAEEIEAIRQVVIDEIAARDRQPTKDTTKPELYTIPLTRGRRPTEPRLDISSNTSASNLAEHRTPPGSTPTPGQPLKRGRSQFEKPLILSIPPNLLSTISTRSEAPAPYTSPHTDSASQSPLSSLVALSPEIPDGFPDPGHRRVPKAASKLCAKPAPSATVSTAPAAAQWRPSVMNEDCVVTYAPDRVRQVKAERTGWFMEASLLCGVRFLVV